MNTASNIRSKVLVIIGDASETLDTLYPYYRLQESGYHPVVAAPEKRLYQMVMHEVRGGRSPRNGRDTRSRLTSLSAKSTKPSISASSSPVAVRPNTSARIRT